MSTPVSQAALEEVAEGPRVIVRTQTAHHRDVSVWTLLVPAASECRRRGRTGSRNVLRRPSNDRSGEALGVAVGAAGGRRGGQAGYIVTGSGAQTTEHVRAERGLSEEWAERRRLFEGGK